MLTGHAQVALGSTYPQNTCGGGIKRRVGSNARAGSIRVHVLAGHVPVGHVPLLRVHVPTEHSRRGISKIQKFKNSKIQKFKLKNFESFKNSKTQKLKNFEKFKDSKIQKFKNIPTISFQKFKNSKNTLLYFQKFNL